MADVYELRERYRAAKERYRDIGKRVRGTSASSHLRTEYATALTEYRAAGEALKRGRKE